MVLQNTSKARQVWVRLGKILQREGVEPAVSTKFYRAVIQAVLLFGAETWVLLAPMTQRLEGFHVRLLRQMTKLKAKNLKEGLWRKVAAEKVLQGAGTQLIQNYLERRKATVAEWVALRSIFEVCARETGYGGGGNTRNPRLRQEAAEKQLRVMLEEILEEARERRQQESGRHGEGEGG